MSLPYRLRLYFVESKPGHADKADVLTILITKPDPRALVNFFGID
jgi:hypothetical protein